jgi:pimeloyl-ACP methyl ester carboxylesterase
MAEPPTPRDKTIQVNGLALHYRDWGGEGVPAIALHGFALNHHSFDEVAPALNDVVRVLAFDQRGHGLSQWAAELGDYTRETMVSDVAGMVETLGLEQVVLVGHSMGGMNAMTYAARHPERVPALVLIDIGPATSVDGAEQVRRFVAGPYALDSLEAWVELTHQYYPQRSKERIRERLAVSLRETAEGLQAKQYDERFRDVEFAGMGSGSDTLWDVARSLRCPTLVVRGGESPVLTAAGAEAFAEAVDVVDVVTIEGAGHSVAGDKPEEFVAAVRGFLKKIL